MQSIANSSTLPLRNLQIEVRQVQARQIEQGDAEVEGARVQIAPGGGAQAQLGVRLGQRQEQLSGTATQMALVLNGRSTRIALRSSQPYRLMQTQFRQGRPMLVPGVVVLETTHGFVATPRWDGSDQVELEMASTLLLPLGEWVTIAQSASERSASRSGLLGQSSEALPGQFVVGKLVGQHTADPLGISH